jgi:hypothetical protein
MQMLSDLQAKIIGEGESAQKVYDEFSEWCEDRSKDTGFEIKTGKSQSEELQATIQAQSERVEELTTKVDELASSIATNEADLKAASQIRAKENSDFVAEEKELLELVSMLQRAIAILEREMQKGGAAMVQMKRANTLAQVMSTLVEASAFSSADASKLSALIQSTQESDDADADMGAPAAAVYEGQSGNIIETMQGLLEKAESQLADARQKEVAAANNFAMLKQSLVDATKFANKDLADAKQGIEASTEKKAVAQGDLDVTTADLKQDVASLGDLHHNCMTKAQDFEAETKSRADELAALANAKKIIAETTGGAAGQSYSLFQRSSLSSGVDLANFEVVRFVRDLARKQNEPALAQLASRMASAMRMSTASGDDPFAKVKSLISDMIAKLEDSAAADASHKAYCDKELGETNAKREDKTAEISKLTTKIDQMNSRSAQLKEHVAALQSQLAGLASSQAEMDKMRAEEKSAFDQNKAEMEKGLEGVKAALKVLRDYYAQEKSHDAAEGAGASIIGLLEVCESDFSKGLAEMVATEESAQNTYDQETKDNELEKTMKDQDVKYKGKESSSLDKAVGDSSSDRSGVQAELDAVMEYLDKLKAQCVEVAETYAERTARREAEIAGLKEALGILGGEAFLQKSSRRTFRGAKLSAGL